MSDDARAVIRCRGHLCPVAGERNHVPNVLG